MLDRLSVLVQGLGYGLAATTLQGLIYIAVEIPTEYVNSASYGPLASEVSVSARFRLKGEKAELLWGKINATAGARIGFETEVWDTKSGKVQANAGTVVAILPIRLQSTSTSGTLLATGKHDLSDEELTAMVLELLNG